MCVAYVLRVCVTSVRVCVCRLGNGLAEPDAPSFLTRAAIANPYAHDNTNTTSHNQQTATDDAMTDIDALLLAEEEQLARVMQESLLQRRRSTAAGATHTQGSDNATSPANRAEAGQRGGSDSSARNGLVPATAEDEEEMLQRALALSLADAAAAPSAATAAAGAGVGVGVGPDQEHAVDTLVRELGAGLGAPPRQ